MDLREHRAFAAGHVAGSANVELNERLATYLGWLVPWNASVTLLGVTEGEVDQAQRELVRIGIERPVAVATGGPHDWAGLEPLVRYPRATFHDLADALAGPDPPTVLDVRLPSERIGWHIRGSLRVPIPEVLGRIDQIPERPLWILGRGRQVGVAAALLHAHGRDVTAVDDDFANAADAGLPLTNSARR
ncbi:rhodanese-like domain-containing protein [Pseudonocardia xinjiangensis]|uniref:Rhodanese-like domain-containing protein n=1 Tax=Pseudonocardia xinjiangensis TaxID=75289 RepID=A0ABX1R611_9PSEU|nr:rhodanese-like domain-containing protein [Pseudonocardia xinjiangensis]NMH75807.1 rhodanese-like domain-containing protein [Pseudonocardia xinjiangensis]